MKEIITTDLAFAGVGPYSQAVRANGFVFLSGQLGFSPQTHKLAPGGVEAQARQALDNVSAILAAAGTDWSNVVKVTIFLVNIEDFEVMNRVYKAYIPDASPARTAIAAARLPREALIEIDVVAIAGSR
jgi:2-iminobutanoate/2-iminopropanoate deaminase